MPRIITNPRALDAQFVPSELHHREGAIEELKSAIRPVVNGYPAEDICLYGPAGVGKTTLAKYLLD
jgi:Cdc6-like AAA superfamily ATPase